ncbi:MAG: hypothetical protein IT271_12545 [Chitinophagales bacterium]|nr:hypothetical protein [Chitinophagales bacterium]
MPGVKIGTTIIALAKKAGNIDTNTQEFKDLLSANLEVPQAINDALVNLVEGSLEAAIKNPNVRSRIIAEVMSPVDKALEKMYEKYDLSEEDIEDINSKTTTRDKLKAFDAKVEAAYKTAKEAQKPDAKDTAAIEAQIKAQYEKQYNDQIKKSNLSAEEKLKAKDLQMDELQKDFFIEKGLLGKKLNFDEKIPMDIQLMTASMGYKKHLQENGFKLVKEASGIKILKSDDTPVYNPKNEIYKASDHLESYLAENNLLVVKQEPTPPGPHRQQQQQQQVEPGAVVNQGAVDLIDQQIANLG